MLTKKVLSSSAIKKIAACVLATSILAANAVPAYVVEIKALYVSMDVIGHAPAVLDSIGLNGLNDLVMSGFFKDNNLDNSPLKDKRQGRLNTKSDFAGLGITKESKPVLCKMFKNEADIKNLFTGKNSTPADFDVGTAQKRRLYCLGSTQTDYKSRIMDWFASARSLTEPSMLILSAQVLKTTGTPNFQKQDFGFFLFLAANKNQV